MQLTQQEMAARVQQCDYCTKQAAHITLWSAYCPEHNRQRLLQLIKPCDHPLRGGYFSLGCKHDWKAS